LRKEGAKAVISEQLEVIRKQYFDSKYMNTIQYYNKLKENMGLVSTNCIQAKFTLTANC